MSAGPAALLLAAGDHLMLYRCGSAVGDPVPPSPIGQPRPALGIEPAHPPMRALPRDAQFFGHVRDWASLTANTLDQRPAAMERQPCISVGQEDLRDE